MKQTNKTPDSEGTMILQNTRNTDTATQQHTPEHLYCQQHCWGNLISCMVQACLSFDTHTAGTIARAGTRQDKKCDVTCYTLQVSPPVAVNYS